MEIDKKADQRQTRSLTAAATSHLTRSTSSINSSAKTVVDPNQAKRKTSTSTTKPETLSSKATSSKAKIDTNIETLKTTINGQPNSTSSIAKGSRNSSLVKNQASNFSQSTSSLLITGN